MTPDAKADAKEPEKTPEQKFIELETNLSVPLITSDNRQGPKNQRKPRNLRLK
jgi:hypothetical protein